MNSENIPYITIQALNRLPYYLQYLKTAKKNNIKYISAAVMASDLNLNEVQVRKDISAVCTTKGKPKIGFIVDELIDNIEDYLGYNNSMEAVLVGAGNRGKFLLADDKFEKYGLNIAAAFDIDESIVGSTICGRQVFHLGKLKNLCERMHIHIGIIAVPEEAAQNVCNLLVSCGISSIWNFALIKLSVPGSVFVQNENLFASLSAFSQHIRKNNVTSKIL